VRVLWPGRLRSFLLISKNCHFLSERLAKREAAKKQSGGGYQGDPKDAEALQAYVEGEVRLARQSMANGSLSFYFILFYPFILFPFWFNVNRRLPSRRLCDGR
jgi:hypothetical protein